MLTARRFYHGTNASKSLREQSDVAYEAIRYIELLLGLSYGMDTDAIDTYMSAESKNILEIDLLDIINDAITHGIEEENLIAKGPSQYIVAIPGDWGEDIVKCFGGVSDQVRI